MSENSPQHQAAVIFAQQVNEKSNGKMQIDIYPNELLGTDRQMIAMAQKGELDIILPPTAKLSNLIPQMQIIDLPYLFPNAQSAHQVLDGRVGMDLLNRMTSHELQGISFWESGFKQITSNKPINQIEDFKRIKFRTMESQLLKSQFEHWGAQSLVINFNKTKEVLAKGIVDGQENPLNSIVNMGFHDVQKYLYLSDHGYLSQILAMSKKSYDKLSKANQRLLSSVALEVTPWQRKQAKLKHETLVKQLQAHSVEVSTLAPAVTEFMRQQSLTLREQYRLMLGTETLEQILQSVEQHRVFTDNELVIAMDADMSGNSALSGLAIRRGIEIAIEEVNKNGGVLGKTLTLTARNNSMIPQRGLANLQHFSKIKNLLAVFSGISSPVVLAELPFIHENKILLMDPWAAATPIVDNGYEPNFVFRVSVRDEYAADFLLQNALEVSDKVGLLLVDNGWGRSNQKALLSSLEKRGLQVMATQWFEWGKKDFTDSINSLYTAGAEVVIYVGNPVEATKMVQAMAQKTKPLPIISHWGITGGNFPKLAGAALKKVDLRILQTFSFIDNQNPKTLAFVEKYKAKYLIKHPTQIVAPVGTAHAYDLTHLLVKAVKAAGSTDSDAVRNALENLRHHSGLVKDYSPPFSFGDHDALDRSDFILTHYKNDYLVPFKDNRQ